MISVNITENSPEFTINGGTKEITAKISVQNNTLTINSGNFTLPAYYYDSFAFFDVKSGGALYIKGGTFVSTQYSGCIIKVNKGATIQLSGGTFNAKYTIDGIEEDGFTIKDCLVDGYDFFGKRAKGDKTDVWYTEEDLSKTSTYSSAPFSVKQRPFVLSDTYITVGGVKKDSNTVVENDSFSICAGVTPKTVELKDISFEWYLDGTKVDGVTGAVCTPGTLSARESAYKAIFIATSDDYTITSSEYSFYVNEFVCNEGEHVFGTKAKDNGDNTHSRVCEVCGTLENQKHPHVWKDDASGCSVLGCTATDTIKPVYLSHSTSYENGRNYVTITASDTNGTGIGKYVLRFGDTVVENTTGKFEFPSSGRYNLEIYDKAGNKIDKQLELTEALMTIKEGGKTKVYYDIASYAKDYKDKPSANLEITFVSGYGSVSHTLMYIYENHTVIVNVGSFDLGIEIRSMGNVTIKGNLGAVTPEKYVELSNETWVDSILTGGLDVGIVKGTAKVQNAVLRYVICYEATNSFTCENLIMACFGTASRNAFVKNSIVTNGIEAGLCYGEATGYALNNPFTGEWYEGNFTANEALGTSEGQYLYYRKTPFSVSKSDRNTKAIKAYKSAISLGVKHTVQSGKTVSYQWYKVNGETKTLISSATEKAYNPGTLAVGNYKYLCRMSCDGYVVDSTIELTVCNHSLKTKITKATTTKNGSKVVTCEKCGYKQTTIIYAAKTIKLSATQYTYDGKVKKPQITVIGADNKKISASNYSVTYSTGRKNVGAYTVKVTFKGAYYTGSKTLKFTIVPKGTAISTVTAGTKKLTVSVKKQATQTTGYEVWVATDKNFTKNVKKAATSKNSATKLTLSSLKAKTSYYVRVRTYKVVNKVKYYSGWTVYKKTVKTK